MKNNLLILIIAIMCSGIMSGQDYKGGYDIFTFQTLPASARSSALGGADIAYAFLSSSVTFNNPALLSHKVHRNAEVNYQFYEAGINHSTVSYAHNFIDSSWMFAANIRYMDYGNFQGRNIFDQDIGEFSASDLSINLSSSYQLYENLRLGATVKFLNGSYEQYASNAIAFDAGAYFKIPDKLWALALVLKNTGFQLDKFNNIREEMPVDLQLGFSSRFEHLPLRFQVLYHHLNTWDFYHDDATDPENENNLFGEEDPSNSQVFFNTLFRHFSFSTELAIGSKEQVYLRASYNRQVNQELRLQQYRSMAGVALGFGVNVNRINFDYAFEVNHISGGVHFIGLGFDIVKKETESLID